jgi:hypothetical protein
MSSIIIIWPVTYDYPNMFRCCLHCDAKCQSDEAEYATHDSACTAAGGICKDNSNYCDGSYQVQLT